MKMAPLKILVKNMQGRKTCRKFYRDLRDGMSQEQAEDKSETICKYVLASTEYKVAETIFGYYPLGNEVNCLPILKQALMDEKRVVLPRTGQDCQIDFYEINRLDDVEEGNFHVMEPKASCKQFVPDRKSERNSQSMLVLVPGVAFDYLGNRYGYGKGYYDRYFARFPHLKRIALAYTEQMSIEPLESLETDKKMHIIVNEKEIIRVD